MKLFNLPAFTAFALSAAVSVATTFAPMAQASGAAQTNKALGICSGYIPAQAEPDSFEYREGLYRCQYGTD